MSNEDIEQTLIPKDDEEQWRKVLHGELAVVDDNDTHIDAAAIRNYLIVRDEAIAVNSVAVTDDLSIISEAEARVVYQEATREIKARGENRWLDFFKTYGAGALIGGLGMAVVFLGFVQNPKAPTAPLQLSHPDDLNYSDYRVMKFDELPGPFPNMLLIPADTFSMGCSKGWDDTSGGCRATEYPPHLVSVKTFEISQHEVTVGQFSKFVESTQYETDAEKEEKGCVHKDVNAKGQPYVMNPKLNWQNPEYEQNQGYPVSCVSWSDAQHYIKWLSAETETVYRLPSEAEWERAARGGQSTAYFWGSVANHSQANYGGVGGKDRWEFASPVGRFPANQLAVQDTAGNLWEWVQDCWHDTYNNAPKDGSAWESECDTSDGKVRRGGAWDAGAAGIRSVIRSPGAERDRSHVYGFRVARDWQKSKK